MIISLTGFMGCGKSTSGRELAAILGADFSDLDELIVRSEGRSIPEIFADGGEDAFRACELRVLKEYIASAQDGGVHVLALGGGAVTRPEAFDVVMSFTTCVYLRTSLETIRKRLGAADSSRPLFSNADALYAARTPIYERAALVIDTDDRTPHQIAVEISRMAGRQQDLHQGRG